MKKADKQKLIDAHVINLANAAGLALSGSEAALKHLDQMAQASKQLHTAMAADSAAHTVKHDGKYSAEQKEMVIKQAMALLKIMSASSAAEHIAIKSQTSGSPISKRTIFRWIQKYLAKHM